MKRILFVDDEIQILEGLQRMLRPQRDVWDMAFAPGGQAALELLKAESFDVIITDMRMPGVDGAMLLGTVCEKYPNILRIVLSGYTELESTLRAVPVAHQFLLKPCDPEALRTAIERGLRLIDVLNSKMLVSLVGSLRELPSAPLTFTDLRKELSRPEPSIARVAEIVQKDVAVTAKVLQLVNSAFFGVSRNVSDISTAVNYLGTSTLQNLVLSVGVFRSFGPKYPIPGFSIDEFEQHSHLTAAIAAKINRNANLNGFVVIAGLLHDIGYLILADRSPQHLARSIQESVQEKIPCYKAEERLIGLSHSEIGAYLLSLWGLPFPITEAVAHHHHPDCVPRGKDDMATIIYLADLLANEHRAKFPNGMTHICNPIDASLLAPIGGAELLPEWRKMAEELACAPTRSAK